MPLEIPESSFTQARDWSSPYIDLGDCDQRCDHYGCLFWYSERLKNDAYKRRPEYHLCCGERRIYMQPTSQPPDLIKELLTNKHFMENIQAYNQMFVMASFCAKIDDSSTEEEGPINNMQHFEGTDGGTMDPVIVQRLTYIRDEQNELVRIFRTVRDKCRDANVPDFKIRLYNMGG
nr:helitron helicase-like domain-containing protein [Tanacetum cinerariifolium]